MLETPHVVIGAAIATKIPNPFISIPLAFASHFLLEQIPHWNPHLNTELKKHGKISTTSNIVIASDVMLSLSLGSYIAFQKYPNISAMVVILIACFASVLPDLVEAPYFYFKYQNPLLNKWIGFQKKLQSDTSLIPGLLTQATTIILALMWIF
jgi:hypothetical protein